MINKYSFVTTMIIICINNTFYSCESTGDDWKGKVETTNGVKIVKNPKNWLWNNKNREIFSKELLSIGTNDNKTETLFNKPQDIVVDKEGNIYVLEMEDGYINKFDPYGNYLLTIGNKGKAPGEILFSRDIELDSKGNVLVLEIGNQRITKFNPSGKYISSIKLNKFVVDIGSSFALDSKDNIYIFTLADGKLIHKIDEKGNRILSFLTQVQVDNAQIERHSNFGQIDISKDDKIYCALISPYSILVFNRNGGKIAEIKTNVAYAYRPQLYSFTVVTPFVIMDMDISPDGLIFLGILSFKPPSESGLSKDLITDIFSKNTYMDVFNNEGNFLIHKNISDFGGVGCFDKEGNYYMIKIGNIPHVAKYEVSIIP